MTSDDLGTAALVMVLLGAAVAVLVVWALWRGWRRTPPGRRPRAVQLVGAAALVVGAGVLSAAVLDGLLATAVGLGAVVVAIVLVQQRR